MYVLLPRERSPSAVDDLINGLSIDILDKILAQRKKSYLSLEIPRFEIETKKSLGEVTMILKQFLRDIDTFLQNFFFGIFNRIVVADYGS